MNTIFRDQLRKFVLVFFDDILVDSRTWVEHLQHLKATLEILEAHHLFAKKKKCEFGQTSLAYLGHVISASGVSVDKAKIQAMIDWPLPQTLKGLRGFLGLTGYYRKFVKDYGLRAQPLNKMLKKMHLNGLRRLEGPFMISRKP